MEPAVALISMPFFVTDRPSLGLSLLKSGLTERGIGCRVHYLNLVYEEMIGHEAAAALDDTSIVDLIQEWVFAEAFWGPDPARDQKYVHDVLQCGRKAHRIHKSGPYTEDLISKARHCRARVSDFFARCVDAIPWRQYTVVGFSSKFQQNLASLALARLVKARYPQLIIVFGGFNCQDRMGIALLRHFPFVDAVCTGEGDIAFPEFVCRRSIMKSFDPIPGMLHRNDAGRPDSGRMDLVKAMDSLPYPDFDDFFTERLGMNGYDHSRLVLAIEGSRGCWWGARSHCTFCGLNGKTLDFRCKSSRRFVEEVRWMVERYGRYTREIHAVDCILPREYLKDALPRLAESDCHVKLFFEVKANLKKQDVAQCKAAGLVTFQPGIESLVTRHLGLLRKGATALQNIQLIKWCLQYGVHPGWNYLIGIPGERVEDYRGQTDLMAALHHLPPPHPPGCHRIRFDRFSPYLSEPDRYGLRDLAPYPSYEFIYPGLRENAVDLAYFFTADFEAQAHIDEYAEDIREAVRCWIAEHQKSALFSLDIHGRLVIVDFRKDAAQAINVLEGKARRLYAACDQIHERAYLIRLLSDGEGTGTDGAQFDKLVAPLLEARLLIKENEKYLSLAVPLGFEYFPPEATWSRLPDVVDVIDALADTGRDATAPNPLTATAANPINPDVTR